MVYLEYEKTKLPVLDGYNITKSSQEIAYSDLKCDFTGRTAVELPQKYEEVKVVEERDVDTIIEEPIEKTIEDFKNTTFETKVDSEIEITKIKGEHRQESREGSNLLNLNVSQNREVTVNDDGTVTINGSGGYFLNFKEITLKKGVKCYQKYQVISGTATNSKEEGKIFFNFNRKGYLKEGVFSEATFQEDTAKSGFWIHADATFDNAKIKIWANTDESDFEQYGISPSPDYPSEIETAGNQGSVEIDIVNKNLFDKNKALRGYELNGSTGKTSSNSLFFTSDYIRVNPNGQYFLSGKHDGTSNCFYDKNKKFLVKVTLTNGLLTVPDNSDIYYLRINARLTSIDTAMIEKGTEKTDYVEGQSQSIIMPIQQEMLEGDYIADVEHHEWKKIESYNGETITTDYISTTGELTTGATVYYKLTAPINLELTDEQKKGLKKVQVKNGINHVTSEASISVKYTEDMIPKKQKRIKRNLLYYGYVDEYTFGEMRELDENIEMEITLLSPLALASLRTVILSGTYRIKEVIQKVLQPLIDDGYEIEEIEITDKTITINYQLNTVEYCMNNLSNKFNFWWFIDEFKKIYIKDISLMLSKNPNHKYDNENKIPYLQYIKPISTSEGYANVVNFKNVRIYEYSDLQMNGKTINSSYNKLIDEQLTKTVKKDEQINFNYPCDITEKNILKSATSIGKDINNKYTILYGLYVKGTYSDNTTFEFYISYNPVDKYMKSNNIGFDENEADKEKEFLLIRDSFFKNLIVGFKYNNESKDIKSIEQITSDSILTYNINRMYNDKAIYDNKGIISKTGIVETTVDMNESWKTLQELREIGISYINKNSLKLDSELELKIDTQCNMNVGDTVKINKMLFSGIYIITKIQINIINNEKEWIITCKSGNMLNNFIDIFRGENTQENEEKTYKTSIVHYAEEGIKETFEVVK